MKRVVLIIATSTVLFSCGVNDKDNIETESIVTYYSDTEPIPVAYKKVVPNLSKIFSNFEKLQKSEGGLCSELPKFDFPKDENEERTVFLMSYYYLQNFDSEKFGQFAFESPKVVLKNGTDITEFSFVNCFSEWSGAPDITGLLEYPNPDSIVNNVQEVGEKYAHQQGAEEKLEGLIKVEEAFSTYQLAIYVITDCQMPLAIDDETLQPGYVKGYFTLVNWRDCSLSCLVEVEAESSDNIEYTYSEDYDEVYGKEASGQRAVNVDLVTNFQSAIQLKILDMDEEQDFLKMKFWSMNSWYLLSE